MRYRWLVQADDGTVASGRTFTVREMIRRVTGAMRILRRRRRDTRKVWVGPVAWTGTVISGDALARVREAARTQTRASLLAKAPQAETGQ